MKSLFPGSWWTRSARRFGALMLVLVLITTGTVLVPRADAQLPQTLTYSTTFSFSETVDFSGAVSSGQPLPIVSWAPLVPQFDPTLGLLEEVELQWDFSTSFVQRPTGAVQINDTEMVFRIANDFATEFHTSPTRDIVTVQDTAGNQEINDRQLVFGTGSFAPTTFTVDLIDHTGSLPAQATASSTGGTVWIVYEYFPLSLDVREPDLNAVDQTVEATGPTGAVIQHDLTAEDEFDNFPGQTTATCVPGNGLYPVGSTASTCTAIDTAGNIGGKNIVITVVDTTPPSFATAFPSVISSTYSPSGTVVSYSIPAVSDLVSTPTVSCTHPSGSFFPIGVTTVTCTARDGAGNEASDTFNVAVEQLIDVEPPEVTIPQTITTEATSPSGAVVQLPATATDNIDGVLTPTCVPGNGQYPVGATSVRCTAVDNQSNVGEATSTVVVQDTTPPIVTPPGPSTHEATGATGAFVSLGATSVDIVDGPGPAACTPGTGVFGLGTTPVSCSATDAAGNTGTAQTSVSVVDTTAPVLAGVADVDAEATSSAGAVVSFSLPSASDAVGVTSVVCVPASGSLFAIGDTTVSCTASDAAGNSSDTDFVVSVVDSAPPVLAGGADVEVETSSVAGVAVDFDVPIATDVVDGSVPVECSPASGSVFAVGDTTVSCSASDGAGNSSDTDFVVSVVFVDSGVPVVTVDPLIEVEASSPTGAVVVIDASATDDVDGSLPVVCVPASGSVFALGTTAVDCSATDAAGNTGMAQTSVSVVDTTAPVVVSPDDVRAEASSAAGVVVDFVLPSASDAVGVVSVVCAPASGSLFPIGDTTVSCSASDAAGNTGTAQTSVSVVDTTPPVLAGVADVDAEATSGAGAVVSFSLPSVTDAVGVTSVECSPASGSLFPIGDTTVSCTASDAAGNASDADFVVSVVDSAPPVLAGVADVEVETSSGVGVAVDFDVPSATDVVDGSVPVQCSPASGSVFAVGDTTVSCSASDAAGNSSDTDFVVSVVFVDSGVPVVSVDPLIEVEATGPTGAVVVIDASATDDVDGSLPALCAPASGSVFALGTTPVSCSATDAAGNTGTAQTSVSVVDTTAPVVVAPDDVRAEASSVAGAVVSFSLPSASDAVGVTSVECSPASGSLFPIGDTTVSCSASDAAGNSSDTDFVVSVVFVDSGVPVVSVDPLIEVEATGPTGAVVVVDASATDDVDGSVPVVCVPASGSVFAVGTTAVSCSASDAVGNTGIAQTSVSVVDSTPPVLGGAADIEVESSSAAGAVVDFDVPVAADLVDGSVPVVCVPASGSVFAVGTTAVSCAAVDAAGNSSDTGFGVSVVDSAAPVFVDTVANVEVETSSAAGAVVDFDTPVAMDDAREVSVVCVPASGSVFPVGMTSVSCEASDDAGNISQANFVVSVAQIDDPMPTNEPPPSRRVVRVLARVDVPPPDPIAGPLAVGAIQATIEGPTLVIKIPPRVLVWFDPDEDLVVVVDGRTIVLDPPVSPTIRLVVEPEPSMPTIILRTTLRTDAKYSETITVQ